VKPLRSPSTAFVLRTSFSDPSAWGAIRTAVEAPTPIDGFLAYVQFVDDAAYEGMVKDQVVDLFRGRVGHTFVIVADDTSMTAAEHHLLVIDLAREPGARLPRGSFGHPVDREQPVDREHGFCGVRWAV
jgi:hypothetical protein